MYCPTINQAKALAEKYHNSSTYKHVCRVADYVAECPGVPDAMRNDCIVLAYMHDLVEDTDMKDHLNQTETLSERRKEKYLSGLRFLL